MNGLADAFARTTDPATSKEAAASVDGATVALRVLADLRLNGRATTHQIAERMGLSLVTVSPRMKPLCNAGKISKVGVDGRRSIWEACA